MDVIQIGSLKVEVDRKNIINAHLGVYPPDGRIRVAAPTDMTIDSIRLLVISKLGWIKSQIKTFKNQDREIKRQYLAGESHYFWGRRYLLDIVDTTDKPTVVVKGNQIQLHIDEQATSEVREKALDQWYRTELKTEANKFLDNWLSELNLNPVNWEIRKMKTQWGSCLPSENKIILNSELVKQPYHSLEYVIVHELLHLIVPEHNDQFFKLLGSKLPNWQERKADLNFRLPYVDFENPSLNVDSELL